MTDDSTPETSFADRLRGQIGSRTIDPVIRAVRTEIGAARDEIAGRARDARTGIVLVVVGVVLALVTATLVAAAGVTALALVLPLWSATLVVFAVFAVVTALVLAAGLRGLKRGVPPVPRDTVRDLTRRD
jgi:choline-glycine betaine transporter